jgi:hypothetical protein
VAAGTPATPIIGVVSISVGAGPEPNLPPVSAPEGNVIEWFDKLQFESALVSGVIVTAVELALLLALYLVLNGALRLLASRVRRVPALEAVSGRIVGALQFVRMLARLGLALLAIVLMSRQGVSGLVAWRRG